MSMNKPLPGASPDIADIEIQVYDLAMRLMQLEESMQIGAAVSPASRRLIDVAAADVTHALHHRAFAFQRLEAVLAALRVDMRSLTPVARQRSFFWRTMFYPATMLRSELAQVIALTSTHPNESEHRAGVLMDALADAETEMSSTQARSMALSHLEISRAATRGAAAMATAGWMSQRQPELAPEAAGFGASTDGAPVAEGRFDLDRWIAQENRDWQERASRADQHPRERA